MVACVASIACLRFFVRVAAAAVVAGGGFLGAAQAQTESVHTAPVFSAHVQAPFDINQASEAQLDSIHGVGPATTRRIREARAQSPFRDWDDLIQRVRGVGAKAAVRFSEQGVTVNGAAYHGSAYRGSAHRGVERPPSPLGATAPVGPLKADPPAHSTSVAPGALPSTTTPLPPAQ